MMKIVKLRALYLPPGGWFRLIALLKIRLLNPQLIKSKLGWPMGDVLSGFYCNMLFCLSIWFLSNDPRLGEEKSSYVKKLMRKDFINEAKTFRMWRFIKTSHKSINL